MHFSKRTSLKKKLKNYPNRLLKHFQTKLFFKLSFKRNLKNKNITINKLLNKNEKKKTKNSDQFSKSIKKKLLPYVTYTKNNLNSIKRK